MNKPCRLRSCHWFWRQRVLFRADVNVKVVAQLPAIKRGGKRLGLAGLKSDQEGNTLGVHHAFLIERYYDLAPVPLWNATDDGSNFSDLGFAAGD